ncbi:MAG: SpoVA/SpoVAEb family sporulation membrane protein [Anaeroplasmataceae bacterium]|nr:SpoVA/SpoVAEb family sporulation membrane protein [Anaeroplasmataceae bacterium]MDE6413860.1 SpoVA/SpoVAEb family sporulation membrane protein [Anaeroplasmataceae bacterium]
MEKTRKYYQELISVKKDYKVMLKNFLLAFSSGGGVAIIGQLFFDLYYQILHLDKQDASLYMTLTMVLLAGMLTAFGIYDNLGQIAKCGLAIPITGFANASVSSAMEYHKEGIILGIGANALKLAGSVIVLGTTSAIIVASIRYIFEVLL